MNIVSIREVTLDVGKEKLAELRFQRGSEILAKHGATTRLWEVIVGQGLGDFSPNEYVWDIFQGSDSFPEFIWRLWNGCTHGWTLSEPAAGELIGPNLFRMAYGAPTNPPRLILVQRMYHMPRKNLSKALELAPEMDTLTKSLDVSMGVGFPMLAPEHEMMGVVYRFYSLEHCGRSVDAMSQNPDFGDGWALCLAVCL